MLCVPHVINMKLPKDDGGVPVATCSVFSILFRDLETVIFLDINYLIIVLKKCPENVLTNMTIFTK